MDDDTGADLGYLVDYVIGEATGGGCPSGFYCKEGTLAPEPCPIGTYGLAHQYTGEVSLLPELCDLCKGGYYCDVVGLNEERLELYGKECDPGHWCANALNIIPNPDTTDEAADIVGGCYPAKVVQTVEIYASNCPAGDATTGDVCP